MPAIQKDFPPAGDQQVPSWCRKEKSSGRRATAEQLCGSWQRARRLNRRIMVTKAQSRSPGVAVQVWATLCSSVKPQVVLGCMHQAPSWQALMQHESWFLKVGSSRPLWGRQGNLGGLIFSASKEAMRKEGNAVISW